MKYRTDLAEQGSRLQDVEVKLKEEQLEQKKQLELLDQEVSQVVSFDIDPIQCLQGKGLQSEQSL